MINRHQQMFYPIPVFVAETGEVEQHTLSSTAIVDTTPTTYLQGEQTKEGTAILAIGFASPLICTLPYSVVSQWLIAPGGVNPILPNPTPTFPSGIGNQ